VADATCLFLEDWPPASASLRDPKLPVEAGAEVVVDIDRLTCASSMTVSTAVHLVHS